MANDPETEAECKARGGTPLWDPYTKRYIGCYPPKIGNPLQPIVDKVKRQARDRAILLVGAILFVGAVWYSD